MKTNKTEKKSPNFGKILLVLAFTAVGGLCGFISTRYFAAFEATGGNFLLYLGLLMLNLYFILFLQIVLHEAGHLLFGLLSGYRFSSFRVGSFMWQKEENTGKLRLRRFSLAGTGGQCLMLPPPMVEGRFPYVLYNLGGVLVNLFFGILGLLLFLPLREHVYLGPVTLMFSAVGFAYALINGLPVPMGDVNNDGRNALYLGRDEKALRAFWLQLSANGEVSRGKRLKDMEEDWFALPDEEAMQNPLCATIGVFACNRKMDQGDYAGAAALMDQYLSMEKSGIQPIYRGLLVCDRMTAALLLDDPEKARDLYSKEQQQFMRAMKRFLSIPRTEYVLSLLLEKDAQAAEKAKLAFEKIAEKYPYPADVQGERELMAKAEGKAAV